MANTVLFLLLQKIVFLNKTNDLPENDIEAKILKKAPPV